MERCLDTAEGLRTERSGALQPANWGKTLYEAHQAGNLQGRDDRRGLEVVRRGDLRTRLERRSGIARRNVIGFAATRKLPQTCQVPQIVPSREKI